MKRVLKKKPYAPQQTRARGFTGDHTTKREWDSRAAETVMECDTDEEGIQRPWSWRVANTRGALSTSVEEIVEKSTVQEPREPTEVSASVTQAEESGFTPPLLSLQSKAVPALSVEATTDVSLPQQQRVPRGIAKVFLQAVAKEGLPTIEEVRALPREGEDTQPSVPLMERGEERPVLAIQTHSEEGRGSGLCERGQCEFVVSNPQVRTTSVVAVILTGNPGPVVVQYISLQPDKGFTVHLSAPAQQITPFNYTLL